MKDFDYDAWIARNAERIGVRRVKLKEAFDHQFSGEQEPDEPFESADRWIATYRYTHGGQSRFFREILFNKQLYGSKCPGCGKVFCPPRSDCHHCYLKTEWVPLNGLGTIESYTTVHFGTSAAIRKFPFICAYIKLDGTDTVVCANIEMDDVEKAHVGMRVKVVFKEERDGLFTDFFFEPLEQSDA